MPMINDGKAKFVALWLEYCKALSGFAFKVFCKRMFSKTAACSHSGFQSITNIPWQTKYGEFSFQTEVFLCVLWHCKQYLHLFQTRILNLQWSARTDDGENFTSDTDWLTSVNSCKVDCKSVMHIEARQLLKSHWWRIGSISNMSTVRSIAVEILSVSDWQL